VRGSQGKALNIDMGSQGGEVRITASVGQVDGGEDGAFMERLGDGKRILNARRGLQVRKQWVEKRKNTIVIAGSTLFVGSIEKIAQRSAK